MQSSLNSLNVSQDKPSGCGFVMNSCFGFTSKGGECVESSVTLTRSLTQVIGPAVPGLVLVGESGVKGGSAIILKLGFNVFSHVFSSAVTSPSWMEKEMEKKLVNFRAKKTRTDWKDCAVLHASPEGGF